MEKSIENIWKEGFLKSDTLVAPNINDLYNQKSIHIIEKFKRMFKINLIAIVVFSVIFLIVSFFVGIPLMGAILFVMLNVIAVVNKGLLNGLERIDRGVNSYQYLREFNKWIKKQVATNKKMSTFIYPIIFMSLIVGFWFNDAEGVFLGKRLVYELTIRFPDMYLIYGIPLIGIIGALLISGILAFFGGRIYQWDMNLIYGRVFRKLEELMIDIEKLST